MEDAELIVLIARRILPPEIIEYYTRREMSGCITDVWFKPDFFAVIMGETKDTWRWQRMGNNKKHQWVKTIS